LGILRAKKGKKASLISELGAALGEANAREKNNAAKKQLLKIPVRLMEEREEIKGEEDQRQSWGNRRRCRGGHLSWHTPLGKKEKSTEHLRALGLERRTASKAKGETMKQQKG